MARFVREETPKIPTFCGHTASGFGMETKQDEVDSMGEIRMICSCNLQLVLETHQ